MRKKNYFLIILFLGTGIILGDQTRFSASNAEGNFVVFGDDLFKADIVAIEAERIQERLIRYFNLESPKIKVPIVLVLGDPKGEGSEEATVRIFQKNHGLKLQVNWNRAPISMLSFYQGWVRALCVRLAIERLSQQTTLGFPEIEENELRIPIWITEGIAGMLFEPPTEQEMDGRATLLAKTEPNLSLDQALAELEGKPSLDSTQRALAALFCRVLTKDKARCERFLNHLNWGSEETAKDWLKSVMQDESPEYWWKMAWKNQANQFAWIKLGYTKTWCWVYELETASNNSSLPETVGIHGAEISEIAHPWFRSWFRRYSSGTGQEFLGEEASRLRKNIQFRRTLALEWFAELECSETKFTREDWLGWERLHLGAEVKRQESDPIRAWFNAIAR